MELRQEPRAYSSVTKFVHDDRNSVSVVLSEDASNRNVIDDLRRRVATQIGRTLEAWTSLRRGTRI